MGIMTFGRYIGQQLNWRCWGVCKCSVSISQQAISIMTRMIAVHGCQYLCCIVCALGVFKGSFRWRCNIHLALWDSFIERTTSLLLSNSRNYPENDYIRH